MDPDNPHASRPGPGRRPGPARAAGPDARAEERRRQRAIVEDMCVETVRSYIAERLVQALEDAAGLRRCHNEAFAYGSTALEEDFTDRLALAERIMGLLLAIGHDRDWEASLAESGAVNADEVLDLPCRYYQSIVTSRWLRADLINKGMTPEEADEELRGRDGDTPGT